MKDLDHREQKAANGRPKTENGINHESQTFGEAHLRQMQNHPPQTGGASDLRQSKTQAAAGVKSLQPSAVGYRL
jgi:hypothetical protein